MVLFSPRLRPSTPPRRLIRTKQVLKLDFFLLLSRKNNMRTAHINDHDHIAGSQRDPLYPSKVDDAIKNRTKLLPQKIALLQDTIHTRIPVSAPPKLSLAQVLDRRTVC